MSNGTNNYGKRLQIYQDVLGKSENLVKKYNNEVITKKDLLNKCLKRKKENSELASELNKKLKRYPIWHFLCTLLVMGIIFVISPFNVISIPGYFSVHINLLSIIIFAILATFSNLGVSYKEGKMRSKLYKVQAEKDLQELQKVRLVKEILILKAKIDKAEKIKQYSRRKIDSINSLFDEYESYVGLKNPQIVIHENTSSLNTANKGLKIK